jgi:hypothetical protein
MEDAPGDYPGLGSRTERDELLCRLSMPATKEEAVRLIKAQSNALRAAVFHYTSALNRIAGANESQALHEEAEAIRALAASLGLSTIGRIAASCCKYLEAVTRAECAPDPEVISLHLDSLGRALRAEQDASKLGTLVADELDALVARKLEDIDEAPPGYSVVWATLDP